MDNQFENNIPVGPENEVPPVQPKPSLKARILKPIVLIPAVGAAAVLLTVGAVSANTNKAVTNSAIGDLGNLVKENDAVAVLMKSYDNKGRVSFTIDEGDLLPTKVQFDMWMNKSDSKYVLKASAVGEDAALYISDTDLIGKTSILSDAYGLNFETLFDDLKDSELFGDYSDVIDEMEEYITTVSAQLSDMKQTNKDGEKLFDKYYTMLFETIFDNADVSSTKEDGNRVITIVVDGDCLAKSIDEVWKKAAKDKKLTGYLDDNLNVELLGISDDYDSWREILSDSDIREDVCGVIENIDFEVEVQITASSVAHNLKKLKVSLEIEGYDVGSVTIDRTEKNVTKFKLVAARETLISLKLTEDGDDLSGKLEVLGEEVFSFKWDYTKKEKSYKLTMDLPTEDLRIVLKGDYEATSKRFYLKAKTLQVEEDGEKLLDMELNVALEIVSGEKTPDFPKSYTNVFDLTEDDLEAILDEIMDWAEEFRDSEYYEILNDLF